MFFLWKKKVHFGVLRKEMVDLCGFGEENNLILQSFDEENGLFLGFDE